MRSHITLLTMLSNSPGQISQRMKFATSCISPMYENFNQMTDETIFLIASRRKHRLLDTKSGGLLAYK